MPICSYVNTHYEVQYPVDILVSSSYESLLSNSDVCDVIGVNIASIFFFSS